MPHSAAAGKERKRVSRASSTLLMYLGAYFEDAIHVASIRDERLSHSDILISREESRSPIGSIIERVSTGNFLGIVFILFIKLRYTTDNVRPHRGRIKEESGDNDVDANERRKY